MADKQHRENLIDYARNKSRRAIISILWEETFEFADACDSSIVIKRYLKDLLGKRLKIQVLTYIESLFNFH